MKKLLGNHYKYIRFYRNKMEFYFWRILALRYASTNKLVFHSRGIQRVVVIYCLYFYIYIHIYILIYSFFVHSFNLFTRKYRRKLTDGRCLNNTSLMYIPDNCMRTPETDN